MALSDKTIRNAKPGVNPETGKSCGDYKLFDGGGLFLLVTPKGKYWRYKYRLAGKEKKASFGTYPETSLADAREAHAKMRKQVEAGDDPVEARQQEKAGKEAVRAAHRPFCEIAQEWYDAMIPASASPATKDRAQRAIRNFNAAFGNKNITDVTVADLAKVLTKREKAGNYATREREQLIAIKIAGCCVGRGYLKFNPFRDVKFTDSFTSPGSVHTSRPALPYQDALIELQLDHNDASTQAIYDRGGMWEERCELMQLWADRIDEMRGDQPKLKAVA